VHLLEVHVVQWLRLLGRLGPFGEQIVESEHARCNKWHRQWACTKNWAKRVTLMDERRRAGDNPLVKGRMDLAESNAKRKFSNESISRKEGKKESAEKVKSEKKQKTKDDLIVD
jgi:hypothetical protein